MGIARKQFKRRQVKRKQLEIIEVMSRRRTGTLISEKVVTRQTGPTRNVDRRTCRIARSTCEPQSQHRHCRGHPGLCRSNPNWCVIGGETPSIRPCDRCERYVVRSSRPPVSDRLRSWLARFVSKCG